MANIKISELNPLLTVQDADVLPIVDNGVTKKVTAAILRSYTQGNSVLLTGAQTVAGIKTFTSQLASTVATGTAPFSVASTTKVTNLNADLLDGLSSADFQATLSGTGIVKSTAGTISYLTDNTANWDTAYNDKINSAAVTGSGTNTLTLTQQDAGTITATWVNGTLIREVRNTTGATLTKGTIVYISGATGNKPTVTKAIASGDSTSAQTFGFIQSDLANNANGYVVVVGDLTGVDTSAFAEGDQLYLSSTVAGAFTSTKQYAPAHLVYVGIVTRSHPTLGQIEVNIQNGYELDELHNVSAQSPSNGDILQFVTSTGLWTKVAGTTTNISEGTNLYFTNARSRSAISESVTGLDYNSTTGVLSTTSGYGIPTTASQATWDTAYNDSIVSAAVTGTTTKTLTLNQQDGGTVTASWTDINTDAVSSVFGRTGAVVAASGDYTTTQVTEGTNLYFTDARARAAISLTTTGTSGAATYSGGVLNIPQYQAALTNPVTGTGTTNYLPKFTGTSALGDSQIFDNGSGFIGFGTTTAIGNATNKVFKIEGADSANIILTDTGGATGGLTSFGSELNLSTSTNHALWFGTNGTERMRITSLGNVGIGTTNPLNKLVISNGGAQGLEIGADATYNVNLAAYNRATSAYIPFQIDASKYYFGIGNVLIGTTTDAGYKLDVNGTARVSGATTFNNSVTLSGTNTYISLNRTANTNSNALIYQTNSTYDWFLGSNPLGANDSDYNFYSYGTSSIVLKLAKSTGAATFSSSVSATNILVGTTTPSYPLFIVRDGAGVAAQIQNSSSYAHLRLQSSGSNQNAYITLNCTGTGFGVFQLNDTDRMTIKSNTINISSIPTSSAGLSAGDIWSDGGTLKIV